MRKLFKISIFGVTKHCTSHQFSVMSIATSRLRVNTVFTALPYGYCLKIDKKDEDDDSWKAEAKTLRTVDAELRPLLRMNLSFAGCGLLAIYHLGVAKMIATHGHRFMMNVQRFGGASAGALVASILAIRGCNVQVIEDSTKFAYELARDVRHRPLGVLTPGTDLLQPLEVFLNKLMPDDSHVIASNRLFISVTNSATKKNEVVSMFESKQELIEYLLASSYIPVLTGSRPIFIHGQKYYDGGLTDNLPVFSDGRNITVSPFDGGQEICPRSAGRGGRRWYITVHNLSIRLSIRNLMRGANTFIPASDLVLDAYHKQGMSDAKKFLVAEGYYDR